MIKVATPACKLKAGSSVVPGSVVLGSDSWWATFETPYLRGCHVQVDMSLNKLPQNLVISP